jgi:hypothetical protein
MLPAPTLPFRSGVCLDDCMRGRTEITNLSLDNASVAGSNFPFALTLKTLIPRKRDSGTEICSRADLKLLRCWCCCCCCEDDDDGCCCCCEDEEWAEEEDFNPLFQMRGMVEPNIFRV